MAWEWTPKVVCSVCCLPAFYVAASCFFPINKLSTSELLCQFFITLLEFMASWEVKQSWLLPCCYFSKGNEQSHSSKLKLWEEETCKDEISLLKEQKSQRVLSFSPFSEVFNHMSKCVLLALLTSVGFSTCTKDVQCGLLNQNGLANDYRELDLYAACTQKPRKSSGKLVYMVFSSLSFYKRQMYVFLSPVVRVFLDFSVNEWVKSTFSTKLVWITWLNACWLILFRFASCKLDLFEPLSLNSARFPLS